MRSGDWANPIWNFTLTYEWLDDGTLWRAGFIPNLVVSLPNLLAQYNALPAALQADYNAVVGTDPANFNNGPGLSNKVALVALLTGYNQLSAGSQAQFNVTVGNNNAVYNNTPAGVAAKLALVEARDASVTHLRLLMDFFNTQMGSADDFLLDDPTDNDITGAVLIRNPADATGTQFQLVRQLAPGGLSEWVTAPRTVRAIYLNGQQTTGFTIDPNTGIVTFSGAISAATSVTADFSYYFRVYFPDTLDFENFAEKFWRLKQVKLTSVVLSTAPSLCFLPGGGAGGTASPAPSPSGGGTPAPGSPAPLTSTITLRPTTPVISNTTPLGGTVATFSVTNSDGSPFAGRIFFTAPHYDSGGVFAISGNTIIVNPSGPGVGNITGTVTDHVTIDSVP